MRDNTMPTGKWEFNEEVTKCFENMLERSIPDYNNMRSLVTKIGKRYVKENTTIIDIGCSTGEAIIPFIYDFGAHNKYKLFDSSEPMIDKVKVKLEKWIDLNIVEAEKFDVRNGINENKNISLALSVLTLQFTPIEYRQKIVKSIYDGLNNDGALILVEKVLGSSYDIDEILVKEYYDIKGANAYTQEQIQAKRKSLEGVLVPITARWNEDMLKDAGFRCVDCFWRFLNFAGWIAVK